MPFLLSVSEFAELSWKNNRFHFESDRGGSFSVPMTSEEIETFKKNLKFQLENIGLVWPHSWKFSQNSEINFRIEANLRTIFVRIFSDSFDFHFELYHDQVKKLIQDL